MSIIASGIPFYDSNRPGEIIPAAIINSYSALTIPAYWWRNQFPRRQSFELPAPVHQDGSPADTTHPLNRILKRKPNAYQNSTQFWRTLFAHAANYGNGYAQIARTGLIGAVDSLHNMLPPTCGRSGMTTPTVRGQCSITITASPKRSSPATT